MNRWHARFSPGQWCLGVLSPGQKLEIRISPVHIKSSPGHIDNSIFKLDEGLPTETRQILDFYQVNIFLIFSPDQGFLGNFSPEFSPAWIWPGHWLVLLLFVPVYISGFTVKCTPSSSVTSMLGGGHGMSSVFSWIH